MCLSRVVQINVKENLVKFKSDIIDSASIIQV